MDSRFPSSMTAMPGSHQGHMGSVPVGLQQYSQDASRMPPHTLPPLQTPTSSAAYPHTSIYGHSSAPQTPRTPHTPSSAVNGNNYTHIAPQPPSRTMPGPPNYAPMYGSHMGLPTATTVQSSHPILAPAPAQARLLDLSQQVSLPQFHPSQPLLSQVPSLPSVSQPTHVVGSQGRRGILPSLPGRAPATPGAMIPQKDASGKFPCPYCTKTYLHAKHLKRHLLRHTGQRPYMCHLCHDTFSRSDILKRHFQKCSQRRGNPTGADHLAHTGKRKNQQQANGSLVGEINGASASDGVNSLPAFSTASTNSPITAPNGVNPDTQAYYNGVHSLSNRSSRSNSLIRPGSADMGSQSAAAGLGLLPPSARQGLDGINGMRAAAQLPPNIGTSAPSYGMVQTQGPGQPGGLLFSQQPSAPEPGMKSEGQGGYAFQRPNGQGFDGMSNSTPGQMEWPGMFQSGAQDGYMLGSNTGAGQLNVKQESDMSSSAYHNPIVGQQDTLYNGLFQHNGGAMEHFMHGYPNWNLDNLNPDPLQRKVNDLLSFCSGDYNRHMGQDQATQHCLRTFLTVENVKHFIELFTNFQGHWPIIHMPTFNLLNATDGLLLTMIVIGAVYSDKVDIPQVRIFMELVKAAVQATSRIYHLGQGGYVDVNADLGHPSDVEDLQALVMLQAIFTWHGTSEQRKAARKEFDVLANLTRRVGLMEPMDASRPGYSILHQPGQIGDAISPHSWDWKAWVEQEKRSRVMYLIFLLDAAMVIYFNCTPRFDPAEVRLPLPADDAAWDARSDTDCAEALGLYGPEKQGRNITGSRRPKQPDMRSVMRALSDFQYEFQPRATNAFSKFILIHALHVQIWNVQHQLVLGSSAHGFNGQLSTGANTPLSQKDWISADGTNGTSASGTNSGPATPAEGHQSFVPQGHQLLKSISNALDKWKRVWDMDMALQYPPQAYHYRRFGFSRDGVHFFFLAQAFLRNNRALDWQAPPDARFQQVISWLKKIKQAVATDSQYRGQDLGSVGDIDEAYGVEDLTIDMKLLFKPINEEIDSPIQGVETRNL